MVPTWKCIINTSEWKSWWQKLESESKIHVMLWNVTDIWYSKYCQQFKFCVIELRSIFSLNEEKELAPKCSSKRIPTTVVPYPEKLTTSLTQSVFTLVFPSHSWWHGLGQWMPQKAGSIKENTMDYKIQECIPNKWVCTTY